ncbi:MAG: CDP-diacylglycerol--glycerol-3-phosphate 3-phosphatidyltransferase [Planctomycetota bacterium]|jgi:CDP-diacylglycerol--glycerol-3-phosphate 3-phosphatidyltransferase
MKKRFLTIPNLLTLFRIASAPLFLVFWFGFTSETMRYYGLWGCLIITILSEISDLADGFLARRWKQVSTFGKLMDPYADSIFRVAAMLCFAAPPDEWYPLWMPILCFWRDVGTSIVRTFGMEHGIVVAARFWGKVKAVAQGTLIISLLVLAIARDRTELFYDMNFKRSATIMMGIVVVIAWWGLLTYIWAHLADFRKVMSGANDEGSDRGEKSG